jgi:hypothetical protein
LPGLHARYFIAPLPKKAYAFGSDIKERTTSFTFPCRFSMNTHEKEPELGEGVTSAEFWVYDGKLGRRWNVDPVYKAYESPFACLGNNPIAYTDIKGDDSTVKVTSETGQDAISYTERSNESTTAVNNPYDNSVPIAAQALYSNAFYEWNGQFNMQIAEGRTVKEAKVVLSKYTYTETSIVTLIDYVPCYDNIVGYEIGHTVKLTSKKITKLVTQYFVQTTSSIVDSKNGFEIWKMDEIKRINPITENKIVNSISTPGTFQPLITAMIATRAVSGKTTTLNSYSGLETDIETVQNIGQICDIAAEVGGEIGTLTKISPKIKAAAAVISGAGKAGSFICKLVEGQLQQEHSAKANNKHASYNVSAWGGGHFNRVD